MRTTADLLKQLQTLDVRIWVEDDRLRLDAPKGALSPELREELTAQKAEILAYLNTIQTTDRRVPLTRIGGQGLRPLSSAQKRMWLLQQLDQGTSEYNLPQAVRLRGDLKVTALQAGLNAIVRRHEILRTTYTMIDGSPYQEVAEERPLPLQVIDLSASAAREEEAQKLIRTEAHTPFDLEKEWPIRVKLLRLAANDYILLITLHHIASDGTSLAIFGQELTVFYENYEAAAPVADVLPALPIQYVDYAAWEEKLLQSDYLTRQLAYWKKQLAGRLPELDLPTDFNRQPVRTFHGEQLERQLTAVLSQDLRHFCQVEGVTLYMALLAAFQLLLHRYSGQDEILVGSPIANRSQPELENMIGPFLNTLVLRTDLSGEPSFRDLLKRVREVSVGAFSNPDVPFEMILEELKAVRDASRTPLFEAFFNVLNFSRRTGGFSSLDTEFLLKPELDSYFDLTLYVGGTDQQIELYLSYNADLFTAERMEAFLDHFTRLLVQVVENPQQQLWEFSLLTESERQKLLVGWNETAVPLESVSLPQLVERQVAQTPEAVAVTFAGAQLTYRELNQRANQLAHYLRQVQGIQPGTLVAIGLERSLEMVVGILSVLKAGGAYVPLDPSYPAARIAYILQDTNVPVILTQATLAAQFPNEGISVVCLDEDWPEIAKQPPENMPQGVSPDHLAYVIHTSGSTGKPKGVQISHRNVVNFLLSMQQTPGLESQDVLLAVTTLSFDISVLELFLPLISGAHIVLADRDTSVDGVQLAKLMADSGVNVMQATPATWKMLLASGWEGNPQLKLLCGGEALPRELAEQLLPRVASVWNMYGPTETTVWSTVYAVTAVTNQIPIGRPIANTQIYILDKHMQPEPMGIFGELYIGGYGVSRGYLNRPDLTAERFVPNPFSSIPGDLLYKTGDAARYLPDGSIAFIGRIDFQVKIRGFRIELEEIEVALNQHPAVKQSVVIVHDGNGSDSGDDKRLIAYYIPNGDVKPDTNELRRHLQESLPAYMIPAVFIPLEAFPLTPNRKVDRKALPAPDMAREDYNRPYAAPRNSVEEVVAQIMAETLNLDRVGIWDNFFELGGHSMLVTRVLFRLTEQFRIELPLRGFFENPTAAGVAALAVADSTQRGRIERTAQLLINLSKLSDEEVATMLRSKEGTQS